MEWLLIPPCPRLMCSFNRGNVEGTNSSKMCVWCLCMYVLFYVCKVIGFVDWLGKGYIYEKRFEMRICLCPEFECPEVTLCGWQNIKIQLLQSLIVLRWPCVGYRTLNSNYYRVCPEVTLCGWQDVEIQLLTNVTVPCSANLPHISFQ